MIEKISAYKSSDGKFVGTIEQVQSHELQRIFSSAPLTVKENNDAAVSLAVAAMLNHKDLVVDILSTGPRSKPKARAINGGTKRRTPRAVIVTASAPVEGKPSTPAGAQA